MIYQLKNDLNSDIIMTEETKTLDKVYRRLHRKIDQLGYDVKLHVSQMSGIDQLHGRTYMKFNEFIHKMKNNMSKYDENKEKTVAYIIEFIEASYDETIVGKLQIYINGELIIKEIFNNERAETSLVFSINNEYYHDRVQYGKPFYTIWIENLLVATGMIATGITIYDFFKK
jgi:hypothetical protein